MDERSDMKALYDELDHYEQKGIPILLEGRRSSPLQIVNAYMLKESGCYMRDIVLNSNGFIREITFYEVDDEKSNNYPKPIDTVV